MLRVTVNFTCLFDCATGCPYIWSDSILGVSVRVSLDDINIFFFKEFVFPCGENS